MTVQEIFKAAEEGRALHRKSDDRYGVPEYGCDGVLLTIYACDTPLGGMLASSRTEEDIAEFAPDFTPTEWVAMIND